MRKLFLPGFGAPPGLYEPGLGPGWTALAPPTFRDTGGALARYRAWIVDELGAGREPVWLGGHSMGGALAILAAADVPRLVARLTLVGPAGLPLRKPIAASLALFGKQVAQGRYDLRGLRPELVGALRAPRAAMRLARSVRRLDLRHEMQQVRRSGIEAEVIACATDTLVTPAHCRAAAELLGATYRELPLDGGHMWMLRDWPCFSGLF